MIRGYVYDHRYESRMQTDFLRRARREFLALGILKSDQVFHEEPGAH